MAKWSLRENPPHWGLRPDGGREKEPAVRGLGGGEGEEVSGIPGLQVLLEPGWMPAAAAPGLESMCRQPRKNQKSKSRRSSVHGCMGCSNVTVYIRVVERVEKRTAHRN